MKVVVRRLGVTIIALTLGIGGFLLLLILAVAILNAELYGRLTETQTVSWSSAKNQKTDPFILLVLHRILPDENIVEVSLIIVISDTNNLAREVRDGDNRLTAELREDRK